MDRLKALQVQNELLKNCFERILKRLEFDDATDFIDKKLSPPVVDDQDYYHGLERAGIIIREEMVSLGSVFEYKDEKGW